MALHTSGIALNTGNTLSPAEALTALGLRGTPVDETIPVGRALTLAPDEGVAIGAVDSWSLIFGSSLYMPMADSQMRELPMGPGFWNVKVQESLSKLTEKGAKIFGFIAEGASMTYGFEWYQHGLQRRHLEVDGDELINEGHPLPGEEEAFEQAEDEEQRIWLMMEPLTFSFAKSNAAQFTRFRDVRGV